MGSWGELRDGRPVHRVELSTSGGLIVGIATYGARVTSVHLPVDGAPRALALGYASVAAYEADRGYLGASIGRLANRVAGGHAYLDGRSITLAREPGQDHHLHGGPAGFDRAVWTLEGYDAESVRLGLVSPAGDQGYPGQVQVRATYVVTGSALQVTYQATCDAPTWIGLTQHTYWNLDGTGTIAGHRLRVAADSYLPVDAAGIPLGATAPVEDTAFDLRAGVVLGETCADPALTTWGGLDHTYIASSADLTSGDGRVRLSLETDQPGLQVFTANTFDGGTVADEEAFGRHAGVALEPQHYPDSPHHAEWPSTVLRPGAAYETRSEWTFTTQAPC